MGRPIRNGEALWTQEDRDKFYAFLAYKSEICQNCGTRESDFVDENKRLLEFPLYEPVTHKCYGCASKRQLEDTIPSGEKGVYVLMAPSEFGKERELDQRLKEEQYLKLDPEVDTYY